LKTIGDMCPGQSAVRKPRIALQQLIIGQLCTRFFDKKRQIL